MTDERPVGEPVHHAEHDEGGFTLEHDGEIRGALSYRRDGHALRLDRLEVAEAWRNRGAGTALMAAVIAFARDHGCKVVPGCDAARTLAAQHPEWHDVVETA